MQQIEKMYGKGSIMRYGENAETNVEAIPTGSLAPRRFIGKGDRRNLAGVKLRLVNQIGNLLGNYPRFTTPGARREPKGHPGNEWLRAEH